MATLRELTYLVLDELKLTSDDSYYNEEHVLFLLGKARALLLKQTYKDIKKEVPDSNTQTVCLELIKVPSIAGTPCSGTVLRSKEKIPNYMTIYNPKIFTGGVFNSWMFSIVSPERIQYVGYNKWLPNIIYGTVAHDGYLYLKSDNPQFLYLENISIKAIFENPEEIAELDCSSTCEPMDNQFPLEEGLIAQLVELVIKELSVGLYKPEDSSNNDSDDLSNLAQYLRLNTKNELQKNFSS